MGMDGTKECIKLFAVHVQTKKRRLLREARRFLRCRLGMLSFDDGWYEHPRETRMGISNKKYSRHRPYSSCYVLSAHSRYLCAGRRPQHNGTSVGPTYLRDARVSTCKCRVISGEAL